MKKLLIPTLMFSFLVSCYEDKTNVSAETVQEEVQPTVVSSPETRIEEGKTLINNAGCLTCHNIDEKLVGPPYKEIAKKYTEQDVEVMADRIINGSVGVWGSMPMSPHTGLSKDNAKKMVEYILTLK